MVTERIDVGEGWSLDIPEPFHSEINPDGSWSGWDDGRTIDIHLLSTSGVSGLPLEPLQMLGLPGHDQHQYWRHEGGLEGYADLGQDSDSSGPILRLASTTAVHNRLISCWCAFRDREQLQWALATWRSITNDGSPRGTPSLG